MSTNVSLTNELELFIQQKVKTGFYASTSEVIRAGLRLLKEQDNMQDVKMEILKEEIQKGYNSGKATPLDMQSIIAEAHAKYNSDAK
jgi:antitoxin ParD1/3/4